MIFYYLIGYYIYLSVEMIYNDLKKIDDGFFMVMVYNIFKMLVIYNLVIELDNGDGVIYYDYFGCFYFYVVCDFCVKIIDVFDECFVDFVKLFGIIICD